MDDLLLAVWLAPVSHTAAARADEDAAQGAAEARLAGGDSGGGGPAGSGTTR
jgi:hypothetical protein